MMNLIFFHRMAHALYRMHLPFLPRLIYLVEFLLFNSSVPPSVVIDRGTVFAYGGIGVVIHKRAKIGSGCIIGQGITIGGRNKVETVPVIGNEVYLGAGCRVLGDITIGDNVIIGPNAVVLESIPSGSIAVGIPARVVKTGIVMRDHV